MQTSITLLMLLYKIGKNMSVFISYFLASKSFISLMTFYQTEQLLVFSFNAKILGWLQIFLRSF